MIEWIRFVAEAALYFGSRGQYNSAVSDSSIHQSAVAVLKPKIPPASKSSEYLMISWR
jgi:hypothetical protein